MWSKSSLLRWTRRPPARACRDAKGRAAPRLRVEGLEDRTVPALADPQLALAAQQAFAGPMARAGFDLSYLYYEYLSYTSAYGPPAGAFQPMNSLLQVSGGAVAVDALPTSSLSAAEADLRQLGFQLVADSTYVASGFLPITSLAAAAGLPSLRAINPAYRAVTSDINLLVSQGAKAVGADSAAQVFGLDGTGVTVGVLSDSYNALGGAASDVSSGNLPGPANPFGRTMPVNVLDDGTGGSDEGRAMLQIVHDVAPGAALAFATAGTSQAQFAANIRALASAGADVLVDDFTFLTEPMFQDGLVAQAVDDAVAAGVSYFSAAGNLGRGSYEQAYRDSGVNLGTGGTGLVTNDTTFLAHDFDPGPGVDLYQTVTLPPGVTRFSFQWSDPFFSVSGGAGAQTDLDVAVFDMAGNFLGTLGGFTRNAGADPVEVFSIDNPNATGMQVKLAIGKVSGPDPALMKYVAFTPISTVPFSVDTYATDSATTFGHANAAGAETVGAALYSETPAYGSPVPQLEPYSSRGGTPILFDKSGNLLGTPLVRQTPDVVAPDGVNTTFFGLADPVGTGPFEADGAPNFFGTSAAAPHAAGVAALMLQAKPGLTPAQVYSALESSAIDIGPPGYDRDSGWGLIQAPGAVARGAGPLAVNFTGTTGDDTLLVRRDASGSNIEFVRNGVLQFSLPAGSVGPIAVSGLAGNDALTVDESNGDIAQQISFDGGSGTDSFAVVGAAAVSLAASSAGTPAVVAIAAGGPPVVLTAVESLSFGLANGTVALVGDNNSGTPQADEFVVRGTGANAFTVSANGGPAIPFTGVANLNVSGGGGNDTLDLAGTSPTWGVAVAYDGGDGAADRLALGEFVPYAPAVGSGSVPLTPPLTYQNVELFTIHLTPKAVADTATTAEGTPVLIDVLANDTDTADGPLALAVISPAAHGTAAVVGGQVVYTPDPDYNGPDSFTYLVSDANGDTAAAAVSVTVTPVNAAPVAFAQSPSVLGDGSVVVTLTGDDGDPGVSQTLTFAVVTPPAHGQLVAFNALTGQVTYVPDLYYHGPDSFTFTVTDDATAGGPARTSAPTTVSITVIPVNHAPVATGAAFNVTEGRSFAVNVPSSPGGVIPGLATDPDGDRLTTSLVTGPAHGTLLLAADGSFTYTPTGEYTGADSFTYKVSDGHGGTDTGTVHLSVVSGPHGIIVTGAGAGGGPHVEVFDARTGDLKYSFFAYESTYSGGVRVAVGDVNGDGFPDVITATGPGGAARLRVFSGKDLTLLADTFVFEPSFTGGFTVAAGNLDGGAADEVVVGAGPGAGPHVRTFKLVGGQLVQVAGPLGSFFAFESTFTGGANVAVGNYDGSGNEVIVGAAAGGGPRVVVFDTAGVMRASFFAFPDSGRLGVNVAAADLDGDGKADVITGPGEGGGPVVRVFAGGTATLVGEFPAFDPNYRGGIFVGTTDRLKNGKPAIVVAPGQDASTLQIFDGETFDQLDQYDAYSYAFAGGVYVAGR